MKPINGAMDSSQEPTVMAPPAAAPRHQMAIVQGSGPHLTDEIHSLLRGRLRIACTIATVGFAIFFVRNLLRLGAPDSALDSFDVSLHGIVLAILTVLCSVLWTTYALTLRMLRVIELIMFASMAGYFADLQFRVNYPGKFVAEAADHLNIVALANTANLLRWFFLIVLYGMFIPNTWKRCAIVVGCMALTPIVLTVSVCPHCVIMGPQVGAVLFDTVVILAFACAMAIFGSYRISELHEEAYQARKLGQYQLHRKLGSGGMGDVYLGEHVLLRRACAIKLIRPEQAGDPTTLSRFEREVQAMATLTHWNTVEIYDYGRTEDGTLYYVMEYLPGLNLQELVDEHGPLSAGRAIHILRQLCAALEEAHAIGLIHRDIKPSNIIICRRGNVDDVAKLLDFGLVHDVRAFKNGSDNLTIQGTILGSPNFLAPEQARGKGPIDARTDIYSLGALAYFLVVGQTPFVRDTVMEVLAAHMRDEPIAPRQLRPEVPADLEEIILTCLRKNPEERFADAQSLDLALAACDAAGGWDAGQARNWWRQSADRRVAV